MNWFYYQIINVIDVIEGFNEFGKPSLTYKKGASFKADVQPLTEEEKTKIWGKDILSKDTMYTDKYFSVGDLVLYENEPYEIEKFVNWGRYRIYIIKGVDIDWQR